MDTLLEVFFHMDGNSFAASPLLLQILWFSKLDIFARIDFSILDRNGKFTKMSGLCAIPGRKWAEQVISLPGLVILMPFTAFIDGKIHAY